jgi:hypothetical protein
MKDNKGKIGLIKKGAVLVNTSRGGLFIPVRPSSGSSKTPSTISWPF